MKNLHCMLFGHTYQVSRNVTYHVKEYECTVCKNQLTTNAQGNLVKLTPKFKEINDVLERVHNKKNRIKLKVDTPPNKDLLVFSHQNFSNPEP
jgi:hypothetical protein